MWRDPPALTSTEFLLTKAVTTLVLPPGLNLSLGLLGAMMLRRWRRLGVGLLVLAFLSLYVLGMPVVAGALLVGLETYPPLSDQDLKRRDLGAIVVLAAGRHSNAPEYGGEDTVSGYTLERIRYGARLYRQTSLPLLLTGGSPMGEDLSLAFLMKEALVDDFRVPVVWTEERSRNTQENAEYTRALLEKGGIRRFYLVTHAWHMPRAMAAFQALGMEPVPAPTAFSTRGSAKQGQFLGLLPSVTALHQSSMALHEYLGRIWYWLRY